MTQQFSGRRRFLMGAAIVAGVLGSVLVILVLLVLTGIIAEPETVIESIFRALRGK